MTWTNDDQQNSDYRSMVYYEPPFARDSEEESRWE